jgi:16S rRNA (guanine527-N7)-methyltransferase
VSLRDIADTLADRAAHAGIVLADPLATQLIVYFQLLSHWNRKINLTSLTDPDEAIDRLLLEPVAAAAAVSPVDALIDLGSGGGSPAVPLALALGVKRLVMVESRTRKAAFLREALREVGVAGTVETARFEDVAGQADFRDAFDLVSARAVRMDAALFAVIDALLSSQGTAALFRTLGADDPPRELPVSLNWAGSRQLIPATHSALTLIRRST